ncbi:ATP-binding protein [Streptomyces scopuliridis]|uniref:ATP-binding protein n=1 Tax=Streptomyces scopuliridis TaxID=452529 RepID=UPI002DD96D14|nr:ATP-binding protein [Streptomyces scopuliridis]WSB35499.1 ATP-binding protein [Streptomyces scopuliridis]
MVNVAGIERELRLSLAVRPEVLRHIRRDLVTCLDSWGYGTVSDTAVLVVIELLTNVYKHAGGQCDLLVIPVEPRLLITVSDAVWAVPARREVSAGAEDGRGLVLIDELTEHWETVLTASGKDIRCSIRLPPAVKTMTATPPTSTPTATAKG